MLVSFLLFSPPCSQLFHELTFMFALLSMCIVFVCVMEQHHYGNETSRYLNINYTCRTFTWLSCNSTLFFQVNSKAKYAFYSPRFKKICRSHSVYMGTLEQKFMGFDSQNLHDQIQLIQQIVYLKELI